jgi:hypothetical protein
MIKISAETAKKFSEIEKALKALPEEVSMQIEQAEESLLGTQCTMRIAYGDTNRISLPHPIDQLITYADEDRAICGDFCFVIPKRGNPKIHYVAVPVTKK